MPNTCVSSVQNLLLSMWKDSGHNPHTRSVHRYCVQKRYFIRRFLNIKLTHFLTAITAYFICCFGVIHCIHKPYNKQLQIKLMTYC